MSYPLIPSTEPQNSQKDIGKDNVLDFLAKAVHWLIHPAVMKMKAISALAIGIMFIPIFLDVAARFVMKKSLPGIIEIEEFFMVVIVFLSLAATQQKEGHISIELLICRLSFKMKLFLEVFTNCSCAIFTGLMTYQMALATVNKIGEYSVMLKIPTSIFMALATAGLAAFTLVFLGKTLTIISSGIKSGWWFGIIIALLGALILLSFPIWYKAFGITLSRISLGRIGIVFMMILLLAGMPIGFAMSVVGFLGLSVISFSITPALMTLGTAPYSTVASFILAVAPLFIFMGLLASEAGISQDLFNTANKWLGRLPGGLAMASVAGCSGFAAVCGDSMATAVTMGSVALPEMKRKNYSSGLACGALAAGGTLGILIPPSIGFIFYALVTEESVGKLFIAGMIPGILLTFLFIISILCIALIRPDLAPKGEPCSWKEKFVSLKGVIGMLILFVIILGGILAGIFSPTEGGAIGVVGSMGIMIARKRLSWTAIKRSCDQTVSITSRLLMILIGVGILGYFLAASRLPFELAKLVTQNGWNRYMILTGILVLFTLLGCLMNVIPMILLTLPAIFPTVTALGFDPIWFGVLTVIIMEMGQITPPIGVNVFAISSVAEDVSMGSIFMGIVPFFICMVICLALLMIFPQLATGLVNILY